MRCEKGVSKSEPRAATYAEILQHIIDNATAPTNLALEAIQKLLVRSLERDISVQECFHLLMSVKLYSCSRPFVS